jgi:hypothetical protein
MALPLESELDTVSVVLLGAFNPAIFQPMWFAAQELLSREDAENANLKVIHNDLTKLKNDSFESRLNTPVSLWLARPFIGTSYETSFCPALVACWSTVQLQ